MFEKSKKDVFLKRFRESKKVYKSEKTKKTRKKAIKISKKL